MTQAGFHVKQIANYFFQHHAATIRPTIAPTLAGAYAPQNAPSLSTAKRERPYTRRTVSAISPQVGD